MAKITDAITSFTGGISTQPSEYRSPDQVEDMLNCYPTLATGVARRPPFLGDTQINSGNDSDKCAYHFITGVSPEDPEDFHVAVVRPNEDLVRVYEKDGTAVTVTGGLGAVSELEMPQSAQSIPANDSLVVESSRVDITGQDFATRALVTASVEHRSNLSYEIGLVVYNAALTKSAYLPSQPGNSHLEASVPVGSPSDDDEVIAVDYADALVGFTSFTVDNIRLRVTITNDTIGSLGAFFSNVFTRAPSVTFGVAGYLMTDNPRRDIRFLTVRDRVYIVNTAVTVRPSSVRSADRGNELILTANGDPPPNSTTRLAHVHDGTKIIGGVRDGEQEGWAKFWFILPLNTASQPGQDDLTGGAPRMWERMITLDISQLPTGAKPATGYVSVEKHPGPNNAPGPYATADGFSISAPAAYAPWVGEYTYQSLGRTLYIHKTRLASRLETESDRFWGIELWSSEAQLVTTVDSRGARSVDLPSVAFPGMVVHINQESPEGPDSASALASYFVRFVAAGDSADTLGEGTLVPGAWEESVGPGVSRGIDNGTMPISITRIGDEYILGGVSWTPRSAGNEFTAPDPSFVGNRIGGLAYFGGRLAVLSSGSVSLSSQEDNLAFYASSVLANLATDPIDLRSEVAGEEPFHAALPVGGALMIFGRTQQFLLSATDGALTAESAVIRPVAEYSASSTVSPAVYGNSVVFAAEIEGQTIMSLATIATQYATENVNVEGLTGHVPTLIPDGLSAVVASATFGFAAVYEELGRRMWTWHEYVRSDGTIVQRAWTRWNLSVPWRIAAATIVNGRVWLVYTDPSDEAVTHDLLVSASLYEGVRGSTINEDGYRDSTADEDIMSRVITSPLIPRTESGGQILDAPVSLSSLHLSLFKTGYTEVLDQEFSFDTPTTRVVTVPIRGEARDTEIEFVNDGPHPSSWVSASWSGSYTTR